MLLHHNNLSGIGTWLCNYDATHAKQSNHTVAASEHVQVEKSSDWSIQDHCTFRSKPFSSSILKVSILKVH